MPALEPDGIDNFPNAGGAAEYPMDFGPLIAAGFINSGSWKLYVVDDETGNLNSLPQGWRVSFYSICSQPGGCVPTPTPTPSPTPTPTPSPSPTATPFILTEGFETVDSRSSRARLVRKE